MQLKHIILCLFVLFITVNDQEDTVTWNQNRKLTWKDFKGNPNHNSKAVALTASGITFGYSVKTADDRIVDFSTTIKAHFYPDKSWYIKESANDYILAHEQLHFDITELYVRKLRQRVDQLSVNQNITKQLNKAHDVINRELDITQKTYDFETNHSINTEKQHYWENYIKQELRQLDKYKS